jgi:hypothetical protein
MKATSGAHARVSAEGVLREKSLYLAYLYPVLEVTSLDVV